MKETLELREVQLAVLDLLAEFDAFCRKNKIEYVLCGGTLLGAVRHKGYIPWDDDADVMMMRDQYEKLLRLAPKGLLSKDRKFIDPKSRTFARNFARYVRLDYHKEEEFFCEDDCPWLGLDIFPVDFISNDQAAFEKQVRQMAFWRKMLLCCVTEWNTGTTTAKKLVKNGMRIFARAYGKYRIVEKLDRIQQQYSDGERVYVAGLSGMYGLREKWKYEDFKPIMELEFEGHSFLALKNYDIYLRNLFGDYMQIPPVEKRKISHATVYKIEGKR